MVLGGGVYLMGLRLNGIGLDGKNVAPGHECVGGIWKRGIKVFPALADPLVQGPHKFIIAPIANTRFRVGGNVCRIKRADNR